MVTVYIVYIIRNAEAVTRATKETWSHIFCIVGVEQSFQTFDCEPDCSCLQREREQEEGTTTLAAMNWVLERLKLTYYNFKYGTEEVNTFESMEIK